METLLILSACFLSPLRYAFLFPSSIPRPLKRLIIADERNSNFSPLNNNRENNNNNNNNEEKEHTQQQKKGGGKREIKIKVLFDIFVSEIIFYPRVFNGRIVWICAEHVRNNSSKQRRGGRGGGGRREGGEEEETPKCRMPKQKRNAPRIKTIETHFPLRSNTNTNSTTTTTTTTAAAATIAGNIGWLWVSSVRNP